MGNQTNKKAIIGVITIVVIALALISMLAFLLLKPSAEEKEQQTILKESQENLGLRA